MVVVPLLKNTLILNVTVNHSGRATDVNFTTVPVKIMANVLHVTFWNAKIIPYAFVTLLNGPGNCVKVSLSCTI